MSNLVVSSSPHVRGGENTRSIMLDVIIALAPALVLAVYLFGYRAAVVCVVCIMACVLFEFLYRVVMHKNNTVGDLSAVVTGLLLGMNLPVTVPLWMPVIGAFFAIVIVKQLFGGIGKNFVNPALAARVFMFSWPALMTTWIAPVMSPFQYVSAVDAVSTATPLVALKAGALPQGSLFEMLLGYRGGSLGETSALILLAGGLYLLYRRVITWHIPVCFIGTVAVLSYMFPRVADARLDSMLYELLAGGLILGAVFMATDYSTSPVTNTGRVIYGVGCGLLTVFIRYFGGYAEGVSFAILIMNLMVWFIEKWTAPKRFGGGVPDAESK